MDIQNPTQENTHMNRNEARRAAIMSGPLNQTLPRAASALRKNAQATRLEVTLRGYIQPTYALRVRSRNLLAAEITNGHRPTADPADSSARRWRVHTTDPTIAAELARRFNPCRKTWVEGASSFFVRQVRDVADLEDLRRIIKNVRHPMDAQGVLA